MYNYLKRITDLIISIILLIILSPLLLLISVAIYIESGNPVLYKQERVGKNWINFKILKFRTMINGAETLGPSITCRNDSRLTYTGTLLRKYKLDELPQLINVIRGEMSLVGPRPEVPQFAQMFSKEYSEILKIKPGISDFASIEFNDEAQLLEQNINVEEIYITKILPQKIKLYYRYLTQKSLITDFKIIFATVRIIVK
jgi:lipopolysaccharide/colanic/teichoic acid biosynthesis glycosyltransferase